MAKAKKTTKKEEETNEIIVQEVDITKQEDPALLTRDRINLLKRTVARGADDDELQMFLMVCKRTGLDPFTKQIHLVKRWSKAEGREIATIQTGIDGYRAIAERTGGYGGSDDATFNFIEGQDRIPVSATVKVYKVIKNKVIEIKATAYWDEFFPAQEKLQFMWKKMPRLMLAKCAESLALRKAFPNVLSGIYTEEEMHQSEPVLTEKEEKTNTMENSKKYIFKAKNIDDLNDMKERINVAGDLDAETKKKLLAFCKQREEELNNIIEQ